MKSVNHKGQILHDYSHEESKVVKPKEADTMGITRDKREVGSC